MHSIVSNPSSKWNYAIATQSCSMPMHHAVNILITRRVELLSVAWIMAPMNDTSTGWCLDWYPIGKSKAQIMHTQDLQDIMPFEIQALVFLLLFWMLYYCTTLVEAWGTLLELIPHGLVSIKKIFNLHFLHWVWDQVSSNGGSLQGRGCRKEWIIIICKKEDVKKWGNIGTARTMV